MKLLFDTKLPHKNVYEDDRCPILFTLKRIGAKWKLPILGALYDAQSMRYNELKRTVVGITNMMLTKSLRELEKDCLIKRTIYDEAAPHVEYALTSSGIKLLEALNAIYQWGEEQQRHM